MLTISKVHCFTYYMGLYFKKMIGLFSLQMKTIIETKSKTIYSNLQTMTTFETSNGFVNLFSDEFKRNNYKNWRRYFKGRKQSFFTF